MSALCNESSHFLIYHQLPGNNVPHSHDNMQCTDGDIDCFANNCISSSALFLAEYNKDLQIVLSLYVFKRRHPDMC